MSRPRSDGLVLFGASGDLAFKKIFDATLYRVLGGGWQLGVADWETIPNASLAARRPCMCETDEP